MNKKFAPELRMMRILSFFARYRIALWLLHCYFRLRYGKGFAGTFRGIPIIKTNFLEGETYDKRRSNLD